MGKPAARLTDMHTCPMVTALVPHVGGPVSGPGAPTVLIGMLPAARLSDMCVCVGPPDAIVMGSPTVLIQGMPAARIGDPTAHGGVIVAGLPTVLIGEAGGGGGGAGPTSSVNITPLVSEFGPEAVEETTARVSKLSEKAPAAKKDIEKKAQALADQLGGDQLPGPIKTPERCIEKALREYDGDVSRIKDVARTSIVVPDEDKFPEAIDALKAMGAKVKEVKADTNPMGYGAIIAHVMTEAGVPAEIQVITQKVLYAKDKNEAIKILGEEAVKRIEEETGAPPGLGHKIYEEYRKLPAYDERRKELEKESKAYYDAIRGAGG